jgi:hypothetical protein
MDGQAAININPAVRGGDQQQPGGPRRRSTAPIVLGDQQERSPATITAGMITSAMGRRD